MIFITGLRAGRIYFTKSSFVASREILKLTKNVFINFITMSSRDEHLNRVRGRGEGGKDHPPFFTPMISWTIPLT